MESPAIPKLSVRTPPDGVRTARLWLRPLRATDVDLDYDAVMSSREQLRAWGQTEWPAEDFTRAENLADLERHEREHRQGIAYTFTVMDPEASRCLGCVYFTSPAPPVHALLGAAARPVNVGFWVHTSEIANDLDAHLLATLRDWLANAWTFDAVAFGISPGDARQEALLRAAGLVLSGTCALPDGRARRVYRQVAEPPKP